MAQLQEALQIATAVNNEATLQDQDSGIGTTQGVNRIQVQRKETARQVRPGNEDLRGAHAGRKGKAEYEDQADLESRYQLESNQGGAPAGMKKKTRKATTGGSRCRMQQARQRKQTGGAGANSSPLGESRGRS